MNFCPHYNTMNFYSVEERQNMLRVVITRPGTGPEFSFRTRYPARPEICLLVPPLSTGIIPITMCIFTSYVQFRKQHFFLGIVPSLNILLRFYWLLVFVSVYSSLSNA